MQSGRSLTSRFDTPPPVSSPAAQRAGPNGPLLLQDFHLLDLLSHQNRERLPGKQTPTRLAPQLSRYDRSPPFRPMLTGFGCSGLSRLQSESSMPRELELMVSSRPPRITLISAVPTCVLSPFPANRSDPCTPTTMLSLRVLPLFFDFRSLVPQEGHQVSCRR
jgi:hypothetical protein